MSVRNLKLGGTDLTDEGLAYADANDTNDEMITTSKEFKIFGDGGDYSSFVGHSATKASVSIISSGDIYQLNLTTGAFTSKNIDFESPVLIAKCKADSTYAFAVESVAGDFESALTSDSGDTWTTKTTGNFSAKINSISVPTTSLIVLGGEDAGGNNIIYSTDDGATWNDPTTAPSATINCVDMFDGTTGYAVDSFNNIWKTTDGGDTWADTTDDSVNTNALTSILAISATKAIISMFSSNCYGGIILYDNTAGTVTKKIYVNGLKICSGIIESTNGNLYAMFSAIQADNAGAVNPAIVKSTDDGATWTVINCPLTLDDTGEAEDCYRLSECGANVIGFTSEYSILILVQ